MEKLTKQVSSFPKNRNALMKMLCELEGREQVYETLEEMVGGQEILFAILMQNSLQPKNSNRTDAIKNGKYVEIETVEQA